jgi:hypothetical protein
MNKLSKYCNANKEEYILLLQLMGRQRADLHDPSCHQVYCILLFAAAAVKYTVYHLPSILSPTKCSVTQRVYTVYIYTKYQWGAGCCSLGKAGSEFGAHRCIFPKICVVWMGRGGGGKHFPNIVFLYCILKYFACLINLFDYYSSNDGRAKLWQSEHH